MNFWIWISLLAIRSKFLEFSSQGFHTSLRSFKSFLYSSLRLYYHVQNAALLLIMASSHSSLEYCGSEIHNLVFQCKYSNLFKFSASFSQFKIIVRFQRIISKNPNLDCINKFLIVMKADQDHLCQSPGLRKASYSLPVEEGSYLEDKFHASDFKMKVRT